MKNHPHRGKKLSKRKWTYAFISREGLPVVAYIEGPNAGKKVLHDTHHERALVQELEDTMRHGVGTDLPSNVYAVGIWEGDLDLSDLERVRPKFYVYEGGHTHVVT